MQTRSSFTQFDDLRARLQHFELDEPGSSFPFSARLARENGWSGDYAARAIEEYRRFLFLAAAAGHPVSPSVAVDQVWHQHMTYTRSYWDGLCGEVLGRPLHHEPTTGGPIESAKFRDWYAATLDSYRAAFGQDPPADIWPAPGARFASASRLMQVSPATHWIIRKPRVRGWPTALGGMAIIVAGTAATGGAVVLAIGVVVSIAFLAMVASAQPRQGKRKGDGGCGGGDGCSGGGGGDGGCDGGGCGGGGCGGGCGGCG